MILLPTGIAILTIAGTMYLFYKNVIVPEQEYKAYLQHKYRYKATKKV